VANSYEWTEYHLTPAGWVTGAYRTDSDRSHNEVPRPDNAVKTVRVTEHYTDHLDTSSSVEWVGNEAEAARLEVQFGPAPKDA
jgi:hypothetical protein